MSRFLHFALLGLLTPVAATVAAEDLYWFEPRQVGDVTAKLAVAMAEAGAPAPVTFTVVVEGPPNLKVEPAGLEEATPGWQATRTVQQERNGGRLVHTETLRLAAVRDGVVPLPSVVVRFRLGPDGPEGKAEWLDPLKDVRPAPPPELDPPAPPSHRWQWLGLGASLLFLTTVSALFLIRRLRRPTPAPTPAEHALADLARLEAAAVPDGTAAAFFGELAGVIRRFLGERFGLSVKERTTGELLDALRRLPEPVPGCWTDAGVLLSGCDLALYAAAAPDAEERRQVLSLARHLVEALATPFSREPPASAGPPARAGGSRLNEAPPPP